MIYIINMWSPNNKELISMYESEILLTRDHGILLANIRLSTHKVTLL